MWAARWGVGLGVSLYAAYGLLDVLAFPDARTPLWTIRYGIALPVLLLCFAALYRVRREVVLQVCLSTVVVAAGLSIVVAYNLVLDAQFYQGLVLTILYGCVLLPLRFPFAAASVAIIASAYLILTRAPGPGDAAPFSNVFDVVTTSVFALFANYVIERYKRRGFLQLCLLNVEKERMRQLSLVDGLTGIANRRAFDQYLAREWDHATRFGHSLALLLVDVDRFKEYNDALGHQAGDACLRQIAGVLRSHARRVGDFVARYGGEEFAVTLPGASADYTATVAERIRREVQALGIAHPASSVVDAATVSVGGAHCERCDALRGAEALIELADKALYEAKRAGRNRVRVVQAQATPSAGPPSRMGGDSASPGAP